MTVTAYQRSDTSEWIEENAERLIDRLSEDFAITFGDREGDSDILARGAALKAQPLLTAALRTLIDGAHVWSCEPCGEVTLSAEQVEALMREQNPEWYEEEP